jgi:hypothetical protein
MATSIDARGQRRLTALVSWSRCRTDVLVGAATCSMTDAEAAGTRIGSPGASWGAVHDQACAIAGSGRSRAIDATSIVTSVPPSNAVRLLRAVRASRAATEPRPHAIVGKAPAAASSVATVGAPSASTTATSLNPTFRSFATLARRAMLLQCRPSTIRNSRCSLGRSVRPPRALRTAAAAARPTEPIPETSCGFGRGLMEPHYARRLIVAVRKTTDARSTASRLRTQFRGEMLRSTLPGAGTWDAPIARSPPTAPMTTSTLGEELLRPALGGVR